MPPRRRSIFSLSPRAVNKILQLLEFRDIWEILQLSKRAEALVKNFIRSNEERARMTVIFKDYVYICVGNLATSRSFSFSMQWSFYGNRYPERFKLENFKRRTLKLNSDSDGTPMSIDYYQKSEQQFGCSLNSIEEVLKFIEYIADLFNTSGTNLKFLTENHGSKLEHLEAIQSIQVLKKCEEVYVLAKTVSHHEMQRLLGGWSEEVEKMTIWCHSEPNFHYDKVISVPRLEIFGGTWFKGPMLLKLDCKEVTVHTWCLTNEDINMFLRQWTNSSYEKLRYLKINKKFSNEEHENVYEDTWRSREVMEEQALDIDKITNGLSLCRHAYDKPDVHERSIRREDGKTMEVILFSNIQDSVEYQFRLCFCKQYH